MSNFHKWLLSLCTAAPLAAAGCAGSSSDDTGGQVQVPANVPGTNLPQNGTTTPGATTVPGAAGSGAPAPGGTVTSSPDGTAGVGGTGSQMPCGVQTAIENNCLRCHGETPVGGAISLTTYDAWHQPSPLYDPTKEVYEVAQIRINDGTMPQGGTLSSGDLTTLNDWLAGGAPAAAAGDTCGGTTTTPNPGDTSNPGMVTQPPVTEAGVIDNCSLPGAFDPLVAQGQETCYEFPVHAPGSDGPFTISTGESYHEWYYSVPWGPDDVWTRYGADFDNLAVLHHFLMFTSDASNAPGSVSQNVTGTTIGTNATLIGGWAVGGCRTEMPEGVGGNIPDQNKLMVQWHMYNNTGATAQDGSVVQICTVPSTAVQNIAGITFLGTENFNSIIGMPPGENSFTTQCRNNSGGPITLIGFNPHMHLLGTNMKTDLIRADGSRETIFDMPFQFDYQVGYEIPPQVVMPGDTLETTCTFFNDTGGNVAFGESTNQEMCYQFALSYPAGALDNAAPSLIGALNTCW
jgi:hypothetical protein